MMKKEEKIGTLLSIRIGTWKLPVEYSFGNLCSPSIKMQVPLVSTEHLQCCSVDLGVSLLL